MPPKKQGKPLFKVGDRVVNIAIQDGNEDLVGAVGTIKHVLANYSRYDYHVEFDDAAPLCHDCGGFAKERHGWTIVESRLELFSEPEISAGISYKELFV